MNWNFFKRQKPEPAPSAPVVRNNPNFAAFDSVNSDIMQIVNSKSVIQNAMRQQRVRQADPTWAVHFGDDLLAIPVATNKQERIEMYRNIAAYPICRWCLEEIADDFIHEDENGDFITLKLPQRLNQIQQEILQNEFRKYMNLFNLRDDGFNLVRRFLTEGELAWENVISPKFPDRGIIGVKFLPAEYYDALLDPDTGDMCGICFDTDKYSEAARQRFQNSYAAAATVFNAIQTTSYSFQFNRDTCVPLLLDQITYIDSGEYSNDHLISYPIIESAKQQYHRLALLEDAAVILRVTHAPERLLFNVSTGQMTQNYADEYVRRFASELKSNKVATPDGHDIVNTYNPVTMLKAYIFGRGDGNEGTSVESVGSSASYDQIEDIEYFLRALLKQFKVPWSRWKTPENTIEKNDSVTYEEYDFSRMIIRFQRRFAAGFKRGFITHLKLRELWDKEGYDLNATDLNIEFCKPVLYDRYQIQKLVESKMGIYKAFADQDEISKTIVMKKYLGYTDQDVEDNYRELIKEKQFVAIGDFFADQISEDNPPVDFRSPIRLKKDVENQEQINANLPAEKKDEGGGDDEGSGDEEMDDEGGGDDGGDDGGDMGPPGAASFGLG